MKITPILSMLAGAALVYWKPIPIWVTVVCVSTYLIFVCLYIKGFNLAQAEATHKANMAKLEEDRKRAVIFRSGNA
jgi:hypothetical protein